MEIVFSDKNRQLEDMKETILKQLNKLSEQDEKEKFFEFLSRNINSNFELHLLEDEEIDCIVFEDGLSSKSLDLILKEYPDLRKSISHKSENIIGTLFIDYSATFSSTEFYIEKSDEIIEERERIYKNFFEKLKVALNNNVNVKFCGENGFTCLHYLNFDEFTLTKLKELTSYLVKKGFSLNEHNFRSIFSSHNLLYTKEVPQGVIDFCDSFPGYSLSIRSIELLFEKYSYNEQFSPIDYNKDNPPTTKFLEENNLDINNYSEQDNITLIKYFTERYNIDIPSAIMSNECEDLLKLAKFEQTVEYLFDKGCVITGDLQEYPLPVKRVMVNLEKEKIQKHVKNSDDIKLKNKRI